MRQTVTELVAYGTAYWQVTAVDGYGWPTAVDFLQHDRVQADNGSWLVDGKRAPSTGVGRLIAFDTGAPGALDYGWLAIRTALNLESAANNYATSPLPSLALKSTGLDLADEDAAALVAQWDLASARSATRYLNSQVAVETFGWNAAELQLVEARQHAAVEVARILNLDPYWVGAQPAGSSVTYSNEQDRRSALLDFTIMPPARVIEQRLSMPDVTGTTRVLRFTTMSFLRANLNDRNAALTSYVASGILTIDEARALEPLVQIGDTPE
jgi:phage portal protein BeeE